jgi:DnaK suppressor protein
MSNLNTKKVNEIQTQVPNHYLTVSEMSAIEAHLEQERTVINKECHQIMHSIKKEHSDKGDFIDRANKENELEIEAKRLERDTKSLSQIDYAIYRIHNDVDFGYCNCCDEPIGFKRLMVRPFTQDCIDCKSLKELDSMHEKIRNGR